MPRSDIDLSVYEAQGGVIYVIGHFLHSTEEASTKVLARFYGDRLELESHVINMGEIIGGSVSATLVGSLPLGDLACGAWNWDNRWKVIPAMEEFVVRCTDLAVAELAPDISAFLDEAAPMFREAADRAVSELEGKIAVLRALRDASLLTETLHEQA